jgi:hypothetical protein
MSEEAESSTARITRSARPTLTSEEEATYFAMASTAEAATIEARRVKREEARLRREAEKKAMEARLLEMGEEEKEEEAEEEEEKEEEEGKKDDDSMMASLKVLEEKAAKTKDGDAESSAALINILRLQAEKAKKLDTMLDQQQKHLRRQQQELTQQQKDVNQKLDLLLKAQTLPGVTPVSSGTPVTQPVSSTTSPPVVISSTPASGASSSGISPGSVTYAQAAAAPGGLSSLEWMKYGPKVDTPKHFKGLINENVEKWLRVLNDYLDMWPPLKDQKVLYAIQFLDEGARDWIHGEIQAAGCVDNASYAAKVTWEEFKTKLQSRYTPVTEEDKAMARIIALGQQRWKGSVQELIAEFDKCYLVPDLGFSEKPKMFILQNALPARIAGHVGPERNKSLKTYRAMADEALRLESAFRSAQPLADTGPGDRLRRPSTSYYPSRREKKESMLLTTSRDRECENDDSSSRRGGTQSPSTRSSSRTTEVQDLLCAVRSLQKNGKGQGRAGRPSPGRSRSRSPGGTRNPGFRPGVASTAPWKRLGVSQDTWQKRMDEGQCVVCGRTGHRYFTCPERPDKGKGEAR